MGVKFSEHAGFQLKRRDISRKLVRDAVYKNDEVLLSFRGRKLRRLKLYGKILEVVTITEGSKITVITAYFLREEK